MVEVGGAYRLNNDTTDVLSFVFFSYQDQVSGTTTSTVLKNLEPDTEYTVTVVPVYHEMEGKPQSKNGKTSE